MKYLLKINELFELKGDISNFEVSNIMKFYMSELESKNELPNYKFISVNKNNKDVIVVEFGCIDNNKKNYSINFSINGSYDKIKKYSIGEYLNLITLVVHLIKIFIKKMKPDILELKANSVDKFKIYKKIVTNLKIDFKVTTNFNKITLTKNSIFSKIKKYLKYDKKNNIFFNTIN